MLSETLKYLFLLFDEGVPTFDLADQDNPLHSLDSNFVFTTEGHPIHINKTIERSIPLDKPAPTCQVPLVSTGLFSAVLSIPDAFHPFTPDTDLNSLFIPYLDTRGLSTPRTILEVFTSLLFNSLV